METIKSIYRNIKVTSGLPVAIIKFITYKNNKYELGNTLFLNFHDDGENIKKMRLVSKSDGFYAFVNSKKGEKFIEKNKEAISRAYCNMVLQNAGYGKKICKN